MSSSSSRPASSSSTDQAVGTASRSSGEIPKLSELGLLCDKNGNIKEVDDNKRWFRCRVTRTSSGMTTYYHLRITISGSVFLTPPFWRRTVKNRCFVVKPRTSNNNSDKA